MPQLDALTYFTQYVYLLITFIAIYFFVLSYIIPKTLCALKVRQKLNSLNTTLNDLSVTQKGTNLVGKSTIQVNQDSPICFLQYSELLTSSWIAETTKIGTPLMGRWLISGRILQLAQVIRLKKLLCEHTILKIKNFL